MPGSGVKGWRAFLSTTTEDAIDRIGEGPWYDRVGTDLRAHQDRPLEPAAR